LEVVNLLLVAVAGVDSVAVILLYLGFLDVAGIAVQCADAKTYLRASAGSGRGLLLAN
jgi:hypothetical protein